MNTKTKEETILNEFGLLSIYNQPFFRQLKDHFGIDLENLVYYREETHYFVMTAKKKSLLEKGVCKDDIHDMKAFLSPQNIDRDQLEKFVREVANYIKLPQTCEFAKDSKGRNDLQIFDFSKKLEASQPAKLLHTKTGKRILIALVGDALVGCNIIHSFYIGSFLDILNIVINYQICNLMISTN